MANGVTILSNFGGSRMATVAVDTAATVQLVPAGTQAKILSINAHYTGTAGSNTLTFEDYRSTATTTQNVALVGFLSSTRDEPIQVQFVKPKICDGFRVTLATSATTANVQINVEYI